MPVRYQNHASLLLILRYAKTANLVLWMFCWSEKFCFQNSLEKFRCETFLLVLQGPILAKWFIKARKMTLNVWRKFQNDQQMQCLRNVSSVITPHSRDILRSFSIHARLFLVLAWHCQDTDTLVSSQFDWVPFFWSCCDNAARLQSSRSWQFCRVFFCSVPALPNMS